MELALLVSMGAWLVGSFICGVCGLGAAIVAMPFMLAVLPVQQVALISCLLALGLTSVMAFFYLRYCQWKTVLWMTLGAVPGGFMGVRILLEVPAWLLESIIGILVIFCVIGLQFFQNRLKIQERVPYSMLTGFLGGIIGTCASIDGPIIVMYGLMAGWNPRLLLGTTSVFFALRAMVSCSMQWRAELYNEQILTYALWCLPLALAGFFVSIPVAKRINVTFFRNMIKVIILLAGCLCLVKSHLQAL